jgi:hypothetical protein
MPAGRDWFIEQRLRFIDWALLNCGGLNRQDIATTFAVSLKQATLDLAAFEAARPGSMDYDLKAKRYVPGPEYRPWKGTPRGPLTVTIALPPEAAE